MTINGKLTKESGLAIHASLTATVLLRFLGGEHLTMGSEIWPFFIYKISYGPI